MNFKFQVGDKVWYNPLYSKLIIKAVVVRTFIDIFDIPRYQLNIRSKNSYPYRRGDIVTISDKFISKRDS